LNRPVRVLVVDDSPVSREWIAHLLSHDPDITVIRTVADGAAAIAAVRHQKPDVITMDVHMPGMDGFETTRRIMEEQPTPILIVTVSTIKSDVSTAFHALEAGALGVLLKPAGADLPGHEEQVRELIETVKLISEVRMVRRWPRKTTIAAPSAHIDPSTPGTHQPYRHTAVPAVDVGPRSRGHESGGDSPSAMSSSDIPSGNDALFNNLRPTTVIRLVAVGASTGGPLALAALLSALPREFPVPMVIVQHIAPGFTQGLAKWLSQVSGFPVEVAHQDQTLLPGCGYVAPDGFHLEVKRGGRIEFRDDPPENGLKPSVARLFRSVAENYGAAAIGVLLTGMGQDGAAELRRMREKGAVTFAQDEASSAVHGMPRAAIALDAACYVLPPEGIATALIRLVPPTPDPIRSPL
jgi:two-component system chemotaxis response regulator CheB